METKTLRKWNNIIHRDLGYFFVGMTIIYALSGIAINHIKDWNPNYQVENYTITTPQRQEITTTAQAQTWLTEYAPALTFKKFYSPSPGVAKIFVEGGSVIVPADSQRAEVELLHRRPVFYYVNLLHYNPGRLWTHFSDFFSGSLFLLAISGMFVLRGRNGLSGRGKWLVSAGILVPLLILFTYL